MMTAYRVVTQPSLRRLSLRLMRTHSTAMADTKSTAIPVEFGAFSLNGRSSKNTHHLLHDNVICALFPPKKDGFTAHLHKTRGVSVNIRKIREDLGRAKSSCQRRDFLQGLFLLISSLKELGGQRAPTDLRSDFREAIASVCADPLYKAVKPTPISYVAGRERDILTQMVQVYQTVVHKKNTETYEEAAERKLKLDHALRDGKRFLASRQIAEAELCFADSIKYCRYENALFAMIARAYIDIKEYTRGLGYLREGLKRAPNDTALLALAESCQRMRQSSR